MTRPHITLRTAHLMAGAPQGGAELFYERLCIALHQSGDSILPIIRYNAPRAERLRQAGLAPLQYRFGTAFDPVTKPCLARQLRRFAPQIAIAWMGRAARHTPCGPWLRIGRLGGHYNLKQFAGFDHLIGNMPGVVDWIIAQGFPAAQTHLLPNFVPDLHGATPATLPTPPGAPIILALGRLHKNKGFDVLIAAISRLPHIHAVIAGDGPERDALTRLAQHAGVANRVHLLGWRTDTANLLAAADIFVCPSRIEPLGNVILEAFSATKPVIAAMADGPSRLITSGINGVLVAQESAIALAAAIDSLLRTPSAAHIMAQAGRTLFEKSYAQTPVLAEWRAFMASLARP